MIDRKLNAKSLEIRIVHNTCRGSGGVEHSILFRDGEKIIGKNSFHLSYDEAKEFDDLEYFNYTRDNFIKELKDLGYKIEIFNSDIYLLRAMKK